MQARVFAPILLFLATGVLGWLLIWRAPDDPISALSDEPEPEPELAAPAVRSAPPVKTVPKPEPPPPQPVDPPPQVATERVEPVQPLPPQEPPSPPQQLEEEEPPDPQAVLVLPDHMQEKTEAEKRKYYSDLKRHHEGMLEFARKHVEDLESSDAPDDIQRADYLRRQIGHAEAQVEVLEDYLAEHPDVVRGH